METPTEQVLLKQGHFWEGGGYMQQAAWSPWQFPTVTGDAARVEQGARTLLGDQMQSAACCIPYP